MIQEAARPIFKKLLEGMETYAEAVTNTAKKFRADYAEAARFASAYKDEARILADKRTQLASKARENVNRAGAELGEIAAECARKLNDCKQEHLRHPVPAATEKAVGLYSRYGLKLSKSEVESLLTNNAGNHLGLRLIDAMLKETGSKYKVTYVPLETYEQDISDLARFALLAEHEPAFPLEFLHEASLIYCGEKELEIVPADGNTKDGDYHKTGDILRTNVLNQAAHIYRIVDGQPQETTEPMDNVFLTTVSASFSALYERIVGDETKGLTGMSQYWSADLGFTDDLNYTDDVTPEPESGTKIEPSSTPGEKFAVEMGKEAAQRNGPLPKETLEANGMK